MSRFFRLTVVISALALGAASPLALAHSDHGKAQFGGVVAEAGLAQFEIVATGEALTIHVSNHGQPLATKGASGKLTVLVGTSKTEIDLRPAGPSQLAGKGRLPSGAKLLVTVQMPGDKPWQARVTMP